MSSKKADKARTESVLTEEQPGELDLLSRILDEGRLARDEVQTERAKGIIGQFVQEVIQSTGAQKQLSDALGLGAGTPAGATKEEPHE